MRTCIMHADKIIDGTKTAILIIATAADRYQESESSEWQPLADETGYVPSVWKVEHFQHGTTTLGEVFPVRSLATQSVIQLQAAKIELIEAAKLTDEHLRQLGYTSRSTFEVEYGRFLGKARVWFIPVIPLLKTSSFAQ